MKWTRTVIDELTCNGTHQQVGYSCYVRKNCPCKMEWTVLSEHVCDEKKNRTATIKYYFVKYDEPNYSMHCICLLKYELLQKQTHLLQKANFETWCIMTSDNHSCLAPGINIRYVPDTPTQTVSK